MRGILRGSGGSNCRSDGEESRLRGVRARLGWGVMRRLSGEMGQGVRRGLCSALRSS